MFSKFISNSLHNYYNFFIENNVFTECQSGFLPGDSCMSELLSSTYEKYKSFDWNLRETFLAISNHNK